MRRHVRQVAGIIAFILLVTPLVFAQREKDKAVGQTRKAAESILDNILAGMQLDDYQRYVRDFDPGLTMLGFRSQFFEANRRIKATYGDYVSREYLGILRRGDGYLVLWKSRFNRTAEHILIRLELAPQHKKYMVTGMWLE